MKSMADTGQRLQELAEQAPEPGMADEYLAIGENILKHWVIAHGKEPTQDEREGFRLLALHRQGADKVPSFNACRETCRELVYHYNLVRLEPEHPDFEQRLRMMGLVANHLFWFIRGKMENEDLGEFCCSSRPLRETVDAGLS